MKKKLFAAALAICLVVSMAIPAFADTTISGTSANISTSQTGTTDVTYTKSAGYTITIPSDIALTTVNTGVSGTVSASNVVIGAGTTLTVTVTSAHSYELVNTSDSTDKLTYTLKSGSTTFSSTNKTVLTVASGTATGSATLTATLTEEATKANQYKDTLTFTVSVS